MSSVQPILLVHGGAGNVPDCNVQNKLDGVRQAAKEGYRILKETGSVLDSVVAAVKVMEDLEGFNAGRGSVLTIDGTIEMEAQIIEGKNMNAGCVTLLSHIQYPVELARLVMEKTPHTFLGGEAAEEFAKKMGVPFVTQDFLKTKAAEKALAEFKKKGALNPTLTEIGGVGTVGCVAIDSNGHTASATSTGGINGKYRGRIGDTPLLGCGGYADDTIGTVSTTGHGESIMRYNLAQRILNAMTHGKNPQEAVDQETAAMTARVGKDAGAIVLSNKGEVGVGFTSYRMSWAYQVGDELHYGIDKGQKLVDKIS
ncbi:putative isoaspartyl peptidase/L-asparaginase GA20639 isoform X2 [Lycorma delicatula]